MIRKLREREEKSREHDMIHSEVGRKLCLYSIISLIYFCHSNELIEGKEINSNKYSQHFRMCHMRVCTSHTIITYIYRHCLCLMIALLHELSKGKKHDTANQLNFCFSTNFSIVFVGANQPSLIIITVMSMPCFNSAM